MMNKSSALKRTLWGAFTVSIRKENDHMNITVYLGSSEGSSPIYKEAVVELASWIGHEGHTLIYGGSSNGLMGTLSDTVLQAGGRVVGVEPQFFIDMGYENPNISELIVTKDMSERKKKMIELGDAYIAFPGGTGTLEEISEIMSLAALDLTKKPHVLYNLNGYYNIMKDFLAQMVREGFMSPEKAAKIRFADNLQQVIERITA